MLDTVILMGSGNSLSEGIKKGLWKKVQKHLTVGVNGLGFMTDICMFSDGDFYFSNIDKLKECKLIIGRNFKPVKELKHNSISVNQKNHLGGVLALRILCELGFKRLYILGFDWSKVKGKLRYNGDNSPTPMYKSDSHMFFREFKNHNIINVSPKSKIRNFPKIRYEEFFEEIARVEKPNKEEIIKQIRAKL